MSAQWNGESLMVRLRGNAARNLTEAAVALQSRVREKLSGNRSGKFYRVPGTKKLYQASAPGEAPASRTGALRNAIVRRTDERTLVARVGPKKLGASSSLPNGYPAALEFGTRHMSPRPFMLPAFKEGKGEITDILRKGWDQV